MYQRILVPIDGSPTASRGLDEAIRLAALTHAELRLVYLVDDLMQYGGFEPYAVFANDLTPLLREAGDKVLREGHARALGAGVKADTALVEGVALRLSQVVIDQVAACGADLIVIGTHGRRGVSRLFLGSDAEQIVRTAPVPVLLVRAAEADTVGTMARASVATAAPSLQTVP